MAGTTLITGSNGGIGLAISRYLLSRGVRSLAFHCRSSNEQIGALLAEYDLDPARHLYRADLCDEGDLASMRTALEGTLGPVTGLVTVAGASSNALSWKLTVTDIQKILNDNLLSTMLTCREFIPGMRAAQKGRIVTISSIVAFSGAAGASHYAATKGAVISFTKSLALELAPKNITANSIALGFFEYGIINHLTPQMQQDVRERTPLKRFGTESDVGSQVEYLLSDQSAFITGQTLHLNGGLYSS